MNPLLSLPPEKRQKYFIDIIPHSAALGLQYVSHGPNRASSRLPYREDLVGDPETGVIYGGAITTLIDATCGQALLCSLEELRRIATLDLRIDYQRPAKPNHDVTCEAHCYCLTSKIAFTRAIAHDGDPDNPVATSAGTFMVFADTNSSQTKAGLVSDNG